MCMIFQVNIGGWYITTHQQNSKFINSRNGDSWEHPIIYRQDKTATCSLMKASQKPLIRDAMKNGSGYAD